MIITFEAILKPRNTRNNRNGLPLRPRLVRRPCPRGNEGKFCFASYGGIRQFLWMPCAVPAADMPEPEIVAHLFKLYAEGVKGTEETKGTKDKETGRSLSSLPSPMSLEGDSNG